MRGLLLVAVLSCAVCVPEPEPKVRSCAQWTHNNARSNSPVIACVQGDIGFEAHMETADGIKTTGLVQGQKAIVVASLENKGVETLQVSGCPSTHTDILGPRGGGSGNRDCRYFEMSVEPGQQIRAGSTPITAGDAGLGSYIAIVGFHEPTDCSVCIEWTVVER